MNILKELIGDVDIEKEKRKKRAEKDFAFFCSYYLSEAFTTEFGEYQRAIVDVINSRSITSVIIKKLQRFIYPEDHVYIKEVETLEGLLDIEPREHGKSTRMSQAFPLWLALTKEDVFPVIVGVNRTRATEFLASIKLELENNERILSDFGFQKERGKKWGANKVVLKNGNAIAALGAREGIRGIKDKYRRPTHIVCDDLLKEDEVESKISREKLYRWFKRVIMNLGKNALIIIVNTIMHPDDLPSSLLKEIATGEKLQKWAALKFDVYLPDGNPLWSEKWTLEELKEKEIDIGSANFATEWRNKPMPDEEKKFRKEWFKTFKLTDIDWSKFKRIMSVEPATGKAAGDYSAIAVVGRSESNMLSVLDAVGEKISDMQLIRLIIEKFRIWKPEKIVFEIQVFQEIYKNQVLREALREGIILPIVCVKQTLNKQFRISKLSPLVEAGILLFREGLTLCLEQFESFPKGHDDIPDAIEMCVSELIVDKKPEPIVLPLGVHRDTKTIFKGYGREFPISNF
ncbi:MAG: phage terminase large subunit [Nitrospinae bacterium]|nr:phage terminase large subunit [Nitrospinota bacterium]